VQSRVLIPATVILCAVLLRAAIGQQGAPTNQPPPSPFSGREDPYFPKATPPQRFPIVNQPAPLPKFGSLAEEPAAEPPVPGIRAPILRQPEVPGGVANPADGAAVESDDELGDKFLPGQIMARVGNQVILYGEVASLVDQSMNAERARITNKYQLTEYNTKRDAAIRSITKQLAEKKLQYVEFQRTLAAKAKDKAKEAEKDINKNVQNAFDKGLDEMREKMEKVTTRKEMDELMRTDIVLPRLALLMKENKVETRAQLDEVLRTFGSSLEKQVAMFKEHNLGQQAVIEKIKKQPEVTHADMLEYYRKNPDKFAIPAKARFELLSVYISRSEGRTEAGKKAAADAQIRKMGNAVFFGRPFAEVAKEFSHEANASKGGQYDWISKGSLASDVIDAAVFKQELNKLGLILEDERGFHIVRVLERAEAKQTPFEDAQKEIKDKIQKERREAKIQEVLASLKKNTTVWTIYDEEDARQAASKQPVNR
jgi:parvulin-like peptidyl-prolyl isomerase